MDLVAVTALGLHIPTPCDLLLFDRIVIPGLEASLGDVTNAVVRKEIETLAEDDVVSDYKYDFSTPPDPDSPEQKLIEIATAQLILAMAENIRRASASQRRELLKYMIPQLHTAPLINQDRVIEQVVQFLDQESGSAAASLTPGEHMNQLKQSAVALLMRAYCPHLAAKQSVTTVPLLGTGQFGSPLTYTASIETVVNLVVHKLPVPSRNVPIEEILAFRKDYEQQTKFARLRRWIRSSSKKISMKEVGIEDVSEELDSLVDDYREYMRVQKMKWETTSFETIMTMTAQVIEGLAKLKFKDVVGSLFSLKKSTLGLLEAELKAPGREIAYLVSAADLFEQSHDA